MLPTTLDAIKSILRADPSVSVTERASLMALLRKGPEKMDKLPVSSEPRILRRDEVARRLSVSLRCVDNWTHTGILRKIKLPGRSRAVGFLDFDINSLITGKNC